MPDRPCCVICGATLSPMQARRGVLCDSVQCAWKHQSIPPGQRCAVCQAILEPSQMAGGACAKIACRNEWLVARPIRHMHERRRQLVALTTVFRDESAADAGITDADRYQTAMIPYSGQSSTPLPESRREAFRQHVTKMATAALARIQDGTAEREPPRTMRVGPPSPEMASVLMSACAACRGLCCTTAGNHAYITVDTILGHVEQHPDHTLDEIIASYMAPIHAHTMEFGCVYQFATGCALPREMRSSTCNTFYCEALLTVQENSPPGEPVRVFFVPEDTGYIVKGVFARAGLVNIVRRSAAVESHH